MQNAATANGNGSTLSTTGYATAVLSITGSLSGGTTVNFEASADGGTTWVSVLGTQVGTTTSAVSTTSTGDWLFNCAGQSLMRARISNFGSGSVTVKGFVSVLAGSGGGSGGGGGSSVNLTQINGTAVSQGNGTAGNGCQRVTVASDNTAFPTLLAGAAKGSTSAANATVSSVDSDHNALDVYVRGGGSSGGGPISPGTVATYISCDTPFTPGTSATDIWSFFGSSSKTVKIYYIGINYTVSSSGLGTFYLLRRSSANSGGTSSATTPSKLDSNNSAATCTILAYTANPSSLGTSAGQLAVCNTPPIWIVSNTTTSHDVSTDTPLFDYKLLGQPLVLRGTSEGIVVNCAGTTPTGGSPKVNMRVIFTEE